MPAGEAPITSRTIWDLPVRLYHWLQALLVLGAVLTGLVLGARWLDVHIWIGVALAGLILARLIWGFSGSTYARFSSFIVGPAAVLAHLRVIRSGKASRHLGHNPLGAAMVVALIGILVVLLVTGMLSLGGIFKSGPAASFLTYGVGRQVKEIHELATYGLLALIALHVSGTIFESLRSRENLARAMITGRKDSRSNDHDVPPRTARPLVALVAIGLLAGGSMWIADRLSHLPVTGMPVAELDTSYRSECGACHMLYHPSLLPADSWKSLMASLSDHFGEDASLDPETTATLAAWLVSHSAEAADSKPANVFRTVDAAQPFTLTSTPFWIRRHTDIAKDVFGRPPINTSANCKACHADAESGLFHPTKINIPKEQSR